MNALASSCSCPSTLSTPDSSRVSTRSGQLYESAANYEDVAARSAASESPGSCAKRISTAVGDRNSRGRPTRTTAARATAELLRRAGVDSSGISKVSPFSGQSHQENIVARDCLELSRPISGGWHEQLSAPLAAVAYGSRGPPPRPDIDRHDDPGIPLGSIRNGRNRPDEPQRHPSMQRVIVRERLPSASIGEAEQTERGAYSPGRLRAKVVRCLRLAMRERLRHSKMRSASPRSLSSIDRLRDQVSSHRSAPSAYWCRGRGMGRGRGRRIHRWSEEHGQMHMPFGTDSSDGHVPLAETAALPLVLHVDDVAGLLRISPKAVRSRVQRGQLPRPFRSGKALAWTRDTVLTWVRDCARPGVPAMKISTRPYPNDPTRFHVDIRFMNPCKDNEEIRRRMVAPAGLDEGQARAWGERQVPVILRDLVAVPSVRVVEEPVKPPVRAPVKALKETPPPPQLTLGSFYEQRFRPEYVALQKLGTQIAYDSIYRDHLRPLLGNVALAEVDDDRISRLRADLLKRVERTTANMILAKLKRSSASPPGCTSSRWCRRSTSCRRAGRSPSRCTRTMRSRASPGPPRARPRGGDRYPPRPRCVPARVRDLRPQVVRRGPHRRRDQGPAQHVPRARQTPKGTIGTIALTASLHARSPSTASASRSGRSSSTAGPMHRRTNCPRTRRTRSATCSTSRRRGAGLADSGPHLLRHSGLTRLANLGASVYVVQAVARHARLQTRRRTSQHGRPARRGRGAARQRPNGPVGKSLAKRAKARRT